MLADYPLAILVVGIVSVLGGIIVLRLNAFLALILSALLVSALAPGDWASKVGRVADAFGATAGGVGIVIALAAIIGKCMMDSGAADRIVRMFLNLLGEKQASTALMGSGFVLAVPVFFDTVFYLLVPLARSLHRKTGKHYLKYLVAIAAGGAITHTLVPPTPGPLLIASNLDVDIGLAMLVGACVALVPAVVGGVFFASLIDRLMTVPMREIDPRETPTPLAEDRLPSLWLSLAPVILPVVLIAANTAANTIADSEHAALLTADDVAPAALADLGAGGPNASAVFQRMLPRLPEEDRELFRQGRPLRISSVPLRGQPEADPDVVRQSRERAEAWDREASAALNGLLGDRGFYTTEAFNGISLSPEVYAEVQKYADAGKLPLAVVEHRNRLILEDAFPNAIETHEWNTPWRRVTNYTGALGNPNFALMLSTLIAMGTLVRVRKLTLAELGVSVETALMSGGVIILITAAGGAFGAMLQAADVAEAIKRLFGAESGMTGSGVLWFAFGLASLLKLAQGSSTVAMIIGSSMLGTLGFSAADLGYHPVYLCTAIGSGSLVGSWMNDSGFWIFTKMGGLTESEGLKSWTILLAVLGTTGMLTTWALSWLLPLT